MAEFLMFADEGNPEQTDQTKFFCYGGTFIPSRRLSEATEKIETLRNEFGLTVSDPLKFSSRDRPDGMDVKAHTAMKSKVFEIASTCEIKFCGYAILHAISRNENHDTLVQYGANILLSKFNQFLGEEQSKGWANFDRLNTKDPFGYLKTKFDARVKNTEDDIRLENIIGYSFTCDGASHASSIADILLGGFRYILNEPHRDIAGKAIVKSLAPTMWSSEDSRGNKKFSERGLVLRPKEVKAAKFAADYQEVRDRLTDWVNT